MTDMTTSPPPDDGPGFDAPAENEDPSRETANHQAALERQERARHRERVRDSARRALERRSDLLDRLRRT